jgi:hypothetical protein
MFRKITLILILSVALGAFLVLRPYIFGKVQLPRIEDRLPDADFLGRAYILDVAKETSGMLYYHKIPFRDLLSYEFILSQGKQYGLNLQLPVYFFANEEGDWGAVLTVSDSSKIREGIVRLGKFIDIKDSLYQDQWVYYNDKEKGYLTYGSNYLLIYKGPDFNTTFNLVARASRNDQTKTWRTFLKEKQFKNEKLVLYTNWDKLKENGIHTAMLAHDSDSVSFSLKAYIRNKKPLAVKMKKSGYSIQSNASSSKGLNIHLDISKLRGNTEDPLYKWVSKMARKISFPTADFLAAWDGDLSFHQGGLQMVKERYIESELDEDFNVTEVEKTRETLVPGFSLLFSVNQKGDQLIGKLMQKGILTKEEENYRFLFSPELKMSANKNYFIFHSGTYPPRMIEDASNNGVWTKKGTKIEFSLDSLSVYEAFGSIYIPVNKIIRRNRFF